MYEQKDDVGKICLTWVEQVAAGKRPGRKYLLRSPEGHWVLGENSGLIVAYLEKQCSGFVSLENLDKALRMLEKSNQLVGQKVEPLDLDISKPAASKPSISLASGGSVQDILSKFLGGVQKVHDRWDAQEAASKKAFVPLPRRDLTEREMRQASREQLRDWTQWKNNSDVRSGGDIR